MTVNCRGLLLCFKPAHTYAVLMAFFFLFVDFTHPLHCLSQIFSFALCESLLLQMFKDKRVAEIMSFKDTRWILPEEQKKSSHTSALEAAAIRRTRGHHAGEVGIDLKGTSPFQAFSTNTCEHAQGIYTRTLLRVIIQRRRVQVAQEKRQRRESKA